MEQRKRLTQLVSSRTHSHIVRVREAILPEWLQKLYVYDSAIDAPSIEVGEDATLFIGNDVSNLMCSNFHIKKGGRVVVQSSYFNLDIKGEFSGEMPGLSGMILWTAGISALYRRRNSSLRLAASRPACRIRQAMGRRYAASQLAAICIRGLGAMGCGVATQQRRRGASL